MKGIFIAHKHVQVREPETPTSSGMMDDTFYHCCLWANIFSNMLLEWRQNYTRETIIHQIFIRQGAVAAEGILGWGAKDFVAPLTARRPPPKKMLHGKTFSCTIPADALFSSLWRQSVHF